MTNPEIVGAKFCTGFVIPNERKAIRNIFSLKKKFFFNHFWNFIFSLFSIICRVKNRTSMNTKPKLFNGYPFESSTEKKELCYSSHSWHAEMNAKYVLCELLNKLWIYDLRIWARKFDLRIHVKPRLYNSFTCCDNQYIIFGRYCYENDSIVNMVIKTQRR